MSETLIYIIIFAAIMFFMHRGHGAHGGGGMGGCGGHSHGSHKGHDQNEDESSQSREKIKDENQHHHWYFGLWISNCELKIQRYVFMSNIIYQSILRCPFCAFEKEETMPVDACQFFYKCTNCEKIIRPKEGDCCVFCSYGTVECPSMQK